MASFVTNMLDAFAISDNFSIGALVGNPVYISAATVLLGNDYEACKTFNSHAVFANHPFALERIRHISLLDTSDRTAEQKFVFAAFRFIHH